MNRFATRGCFLALALLNLCYPSFGQLTEARMKGTVTDSSGQPVNEVSVTATNDGTGEKRSSSTDTHGAYVLNELPPGQYKITLAVQGFHPFEKQGIQLRVGQTSQVDVQLQLGVVSEKVDVQASVDQVQVSTEGRLSDSYGTKQIADLPIPQRDVFAITKLSAGATNIPGAANSTKLTNSPVVTVNGNRYRGNDYVLDGSMNTNPNNTGEPAIVPSLESVEEAQVQTDNFSSEFGRGNGAVVNLRTKSGTNEFHGRLWEYMRNKDLNARNFFATARGAQTYNQYGGNVGGPIAKNRTFFFASYEGSRNAFAPINTFQVETPQFRNYVEKYYPNNISASLLRQFPAPTPLSGTGKFGYQNEVDVTTPQAGVIAGTALAVAAVHDYTAYDQYLTRIDHSFRDGKDKVVGRWISEYETDAGAISSVKSTLGEAARGDYGPYSGYFSNLNLGEVHVNNRWVNDARFSFMQIYVNQGNKAAEIPQMTITGLTAPFGDIAFNGTRLRTYEWRDTVSIDLGQHALRTGFEARQIFKGLSLAPAAPGGYAFNSILAFAQDNPFQQNVTVNPNTGQLASSPRYFHVHEAGAFLQDDWRVLRRLTLNLGVRYDYFGAPHEDDGLLSSIIFGTGTDFNSRLATASVGRVSQLYTPQKLNFSPRFGFAYDPFGNGNWSVRGGFSLAYQPHHGQSIGGARALPPDAAQELLQPNAGRGTQILYGIPVPVNPQSATGFNANGGLNWNIPNSSPPAITGFVVNPDIKTQYSESWFFNIQHEIAKTWIAEVGYVGTDGRNLERIDNINRVDGDLLDGRLNFVNPNFGPLLFVTNGVSSEYNALTAEIRHSFGKGFQFLANYRWSKWIDDGSDTSNGQFADNDEPGKGAQNVNCLKCERGLSMFDIPQRFMATGLWSPRFTTGKTKLGALLNHWELSSIYTVQSGRPFSVWNGASFTAGGDYNADGGGGAVGTGTLGGGYYDRPNAPAQGTVPNSFSQSQFLSGLFSPTAFGTPVPGTDGNLGRNTYRGPRQLTLDAAVSRSFNIREKMSLSLRIEAFNAANTVNLYLPNTDLSLALKPDKTFSATSSFGKSTAAFDPRTVQASMRFTF
jgi:Carboxypeptidase regulatory-like domain/TonB dependent receptor